MLNQRQTMLNRKSTSLVSGTAFTNTNVTPKNRKTPLAKANRTDYALNVSGAKLEDFDEL